MRTYNQDLHLGYKYNLSKVRSVINDLNFGDREYIINCDGNSCRNFIYCLYHIFLQDNDDGVK